jgi:hypothetical protein
MREHAESRRRPQNGRGHPSHTGFRLGRAPPLFFGHAVGGDLLVEAPLESVALQSSHALKGWSETPSRPSLRTLRKLAKGLGGLSLSQLFQGYEQDEHRDARQAQVGHEMISTKHELWRGDGGARASCTSRSSVTWSVRS